MALSRVDAALMGVDTGDAVALEQALSGLAAADLPTSREAALLLRLRSMAAERLGRRDEALALLEVATDLTPEDPDLALQLGVALQEAGRPDDATEAFLRTRAGADDDPDRTLAASRYLYLWNRPDDGQRVLEPLFRTVRDLGRAGDAYLAGRGLPGMAVLLAHYAVHARVADRPHQVEELAGWAAETLEGEGVAEACALAVAFARGDGEGIADWLEAWATGPDRPGEHPAARRVAWALHRARGSDRPARALEHLDAVRLERDAPAWLEDLRAFGRAETFRRFGMAADEARWRDRLVRNQPQLFEPEHVVRFGLYEYQESLKQAYRQERSTP